jgi:hypothetical protein
VAGTTRIKKPQNIEYRTPNVEVLTTLVPCSLSPAPGYEEVHALVLRVRGVSPLSSAYFAPSGLEKCWSFVMGQGVLPLAGVFRPFRADWYQVNSLLIIYLNVLILNKLNM